METYLNDTRFAAESIIRSYQGDVDSLNARIVKYNKAKNELGQGRDIVVSHANFKTIQSIVETFQKIRQLSVEIHVSSTEIANRWAATDSLCGALLQIAKQGISTVHRGPAPANRGRKIGTQDIANIIWQGRNQSMHWEETKPFKQAVVNCFQQLDAVLGLSLSADLKKRSLATSVIDILDWHKLSKYETDMLSIA